MKSKSAPRKLVRDTCRACRLVELLIAARAKKSSSTKKVEAGGAQKTIYMPIQQASNGKTAEAIVIKNDETAKDKADVTDVKIVEK